MVPVDLAFVMPLCRDHDQRGVVTELLITEVFGIRQDARLDFAGGLVDRFTCARHQTLLAKFFLTAGPGFGDAVGKKQQTVSGLELQEGVFILPIARPAIFQAAATYRSIKTGDTPESLASLSNPSLE